MKRTRTRSITKAILQESQITIHDLPLEVLTLILGRLNTCKMAFAFYEASRVSKLWRKIILEVIIGSDYGPYRKPTYLPKNKVFPDFDEVKYELNTDYKITFKPFKRKCEIAEANNDLQNLFKDLFQGAEELIQKQNEIKQLRSAMPIPPIEKCYERKYKDSDYFFAIKYKYFTANFLGVMDPRVTVTLDIFWTPEFYKKHVRDIFDRYGMRESWCLKHRDGEYITLMVWTDDLDSIMCYITEKKPEDIFLDLDCYDDDGSSTEEELFWQKQTLEYFDPDVLY